MSIKDWFTGARERIETRVETAFPSNADGKASVGLDEPMRWGRIALWLGILVAFIWAAFAPLGQGIPAQGTVKVEGERKAVQHPRGGVIDEILVREGDVVQAGQPLIRLNDSMAQAQHGIVDAQLISLYATEARLKTERSGKDSIEFPDFLRTRKGNAQVDEARQVQQQLFRTRQGALLGEIAIARENISGLEEQVRGLIAQEKSKTEQLRLFKEELDTLRPLFEQGFVPRNRMFELERAIAYLSGQRSEDSANRGRVKSQIAELKLKILQVREMYRKEVETQLTDVQRQLADYKERRIATQDDLQRIVLKAPVAGTVVDLAVHTIGGVVQAGQKLMDIVPTTQTLIIEARIPTHLIDGVRLGQEADVQFPALNQTLIPTVPGKLIYIAADSVIDQRSGVPYFVGRVATTPDGMKKLGKNAIQAGMPANVVIKTGERSLLSYLLKPLLARMQFAFTER
jgi:protease secretion system membrane fusion protein